MKKLMFTLACAASAAVMAKLQPTADFEANAFVAGTTMATNLVLLSDAGSADSPEKYWQFAYVPTNDASVVTAHGTAQLPTGADGGDNYLQLETNGDELQRKVQSSGEAFPVGDKGLYIDTLVQFTATPDAPTIAGDAKLAIWLEGEDTYTLKVKGSLIDLTAEGALTATEKTYALDKACLPDTWYRLTVKSVASISGADAGNAAGFVVYIDGTAVATTEASVTAGAVSGLDYGEGAWASDSAKALVTDNLFIPSGALVSGFTDSATLTSVGFQGSGAIDNVTITDADPLEFTLTINFGAGVNAVSYTVGDAAAESVTESGTEVPIAKDATVSITVTGVVDDEWFAAPVTATTVEMTTNKVVTVTATPAFNVNVPDGTAAETVSAALVWAKNAGKETTDVAGAANLLNNYLLNVDDLTVDPQIKIVSIDTTTTPVTVTAAVTDAENGTTIKTLTTQGDDKINASIKYKAAATLEALKTVQPKEAIGDNDQFIQVVVE